MNLHGLWKRVRRSVRFRLVLKYLVNECSNVERIYFSLVQVHETETEHLPESGNVCFCQALQDFTDRRRASPEIRANFTFNFRLRLLCVRTGCTDYVLVNHHDD